MPFLKIQNFLKNWDHVDLSQVGWLGHIDERWVGISTNGAAWTKCVGRLTRREPTLLKARGIQILTRRCPLAPGVLAINLQRPFNSVRRFVSPDHAKAFRHVQGWPLAPG
jgi:hypothetical protein